MSSAFRSAALSQPRRRRACCRRVKISMIRQLNSAKASNDDAKIDKSAKEFESMLLSTWLQQARAIDGYGTRRRR